jgi:hypothetical protein
LFIINRSGFWLRSMTEIMRSRKASLIVCALLMLLVFVTLITGCSQTGDISANTTDAGTASSSAALQAQDTPQPNTTQVTATEQISVTANTTETTTVAPTPSGEAPDPMSVLNVFEFFSPQQTIVKRDPLQLDSSETEEMLFTAMEPTEIVTQEIYSALVVVAYSKDERRWTSIWQSDIITGTASPLPAANRSGGYNGGNLLGVNDPVLMLRASTLDGHAHLYMWRWYTALRKGERVMMTPINGGADAPSNFEADLDVNVADLNNDGIFEVVGDNVTGVQIWKWNGSKYLPEAGKQ